MGQYHAIYNLDKKERLSPHAMGDGAKLLEFGNGGLIMTGLALLLCNSNGRGGGDLTVDREWDSEKNEWKAMSPGVQEVFDLVSKAAGHWAGDRIVIQGDYATGTDKAVISEEDLKGYLDISRRVVHALFADPYLRSNCLKSEHDFGDLKPIALEVEALMNPKALKAKRSKAAKQETAHA